MATTRTLAGSHDGNHELQGRTDVCSKSASKKLKSSWNSQNGHLFNNRWWWSLCRHLRHPSGAARETEKDCKWISLCTLPDTKANDNCVSLYGPALLLPFVESCCSWYFIVSISCQTREKAAGRVGGLSIASLKGRWKLNFHSLNDAYSMRLPLCFSFRQFRGSIQKLLCCQENWEFMFHENRLASLFTFGSCQSQVYRALRLSGKFQKCWKRAGEVFCWFWFSGGVFALKTSYISWEFKWKLTDR